MAKKIPNVTGIKHALLLLQGLTGGEQEKLLAHLELKDPMIAEVLRKNLVTVEDLQYLSPEMFRDLLNETSAPQLALALRGTTPSVLEAILKHASKWVREEIQDIMLGPKRASSEVQAARDELMKKVRKMISQGKIVLSKDEKDRLV